jgi:hypothetical protein
VAWRECGGAVVDGECGLLDVHVDDLSGVYAPDADLLSGDLDGALDADDPVHGGAVRVGLGWWPGRAGVAQLAALGEGERTTQDMLTR